MVIKRGAGAVEKVVFNSEFARPWSATSPRMVPIQIVRVAFGICVLTISAIPPWVACAHTVPNDTDITRTLIGEWTTAPDSPEKSVPSLMMNGLHVVERFQVGGRGIATLYNDANCKRIVMETRFQWNVNNGVLTSLVKPGHVDHDRIVKINRNSLWMYSMEKKNYEHRIRGVC
jgi:hypothetical protein